MAANQRSTFSLSFTWALNINSGIGLSKVGCVLPMVIWSELRMMQYRASDHREDATHFSSNSELPKENNSF